MDEEQDVESDQTSPGKHLHCEEVGTCQYGHVGSNEILPGSLLAARGRRRDPVSAKNVSHRLIGNGMAEIGQGSDNAVVSPTGVRSGETDNQRLHLGGHRWPARGSAVFRAVEFAGDEAAVPGEDGIRFGNKGHLLERSATEPLADLSK